MTHNAVSGRIILPIIVIAIALVLFWKYYKTDVFDPIMLTAVALLAIGGYQLWVELTALKAADQPLHQ